ncbi:peptidase inhibitor family I36 protein [Actomonas aquatica]|uniref:Peptidase inhibitor family I36 protein n=1 Tax=Actomonas aquatica TaxID=2866162 RepID=A0ABZ1CA92_9BACT|nr:peptidase inhibitor family I36 protein [Opitutus sp. WL0086]WRQ88148.1 peptidase inhibitor family I36 protein [Opitutus sp. WL0086]
MKTTLRTVLTGAAMLALTLPSALLGQSRHDDRDDDRGRNRDRPEEEEARIVLFSGRNYTGERIVLSVGDQVDDFRFQSFPSGRNANNRVSSVWVQGRVEVTLYEYRDFKGEHITLTRSSPDLEDISLSDGVEDWDNNLSSVIVREASGGRRDRDRWTGRDDDRGRGHDDHDRDYGRGDGGQGGNDWRNDGWGRDRERDRIEQRRQTERVVKRAYVDVLGREPDAQGLNTYVGIVEDRGWTEERLRRELTRSVEYRTVVVPRRITEIYRELLKREPDPAGLKFYTDRVVRADWTFTRVEDALRKSPEYKSKHNRR